MGKVNNNYKKNPVLYIDIKWEIREAICPKFRIGKINKSLLFDEKQGLGLLLHNVYSYSYACNNSFFICENCETIYDCIILFFELFPSMVRSNHR